MTHKDLLSLRDQLAKLDCAHKLNKGGSQFKADVALGPASIMKGKALLRNKKVQPAAPMDLASMQHRVGY